MRLPARCPIWTRSSYGPAWLLPSFPTRSRTSRRLPVKPMSMWCSPERSCGPANRFASTRSFSKRRGARCCGRVGVQSALGDVFELQDDFTQRIVESLSIPLTRREEQLLKRDVPAPARAYEYYLRGNECAARRDKWVVARDLYEQSVAEDPRFAPAWAQLGRMHRLVGVYYDTEHVEAHMRKARRGVATRLGASPRPATRAQPVRLYRGRPGPGEGSDVAAS